MPTRVTKHAIVGAVFGVIALPIWAALTHAYAVDAAAELGFMAGLVGGAVLGLTRR